MYNIDQLNDYAYEKTLVEVWDCPEVLDEDWPDDLWED